MLSHHPRLPKKQSQSRSSFLSELPAIEPILEELEKDKNTSDLVKLVLRALVRFMQDAADSQTLMGNELQKFAKIQKKKVLKRKPSPKGSASESYYHSSVGSNPHPLSPRLDQPNAREDDLSRPQSTGQWKSFIKKQIVSILSSQFPNLTAQPPQKTPNLQQRPVTKHRADHQKPQTPNLISAPSPSEGLPSNPSSPVFGTVNNRAETMEGMSWSALPFIPGGGGGLGVSVTRERRGETRDYREGGGKRRDERDGWESRVREVEAGVQRLREELGREVQGVKEGVEARDRLIEEVRQRVQAVEIEGDREKVWGKFFLEVVDRLETAEQKLKRLQIEMPELNLDDKTKKLLRILGRVEESKLVSLLSSKFF